MNKNILREKRQAILDHFIVSFTGTDASIEYYMNVSLPLNWLSPRSKKTVLKIDTSDYEKTLINYFENPSKIDTNHPLLLIIGGVGSGKSSSVRYALSKANVCQGCSLYDSCKKDYPSRILVDFIDFKSSVAAEAPGEIVKFNRKEIENRFWYHLVQILDGAIDDSMPRRVEVSAFWQWLISEQKSAIPMALYRYLFPKKELFLNPQVNSAELFALRDKMFGELNTRDLTSYKLYQVAFLRQTNLVNCNFIIFDNIDTLDPFLQAALINFAIEANRLLSCKAIIPLRPHTFTSNQDASDFFEIMDHWKPSLEKVFEKRLETFGAKGEQDVKNALEKTIHLIKSTSIFKEIFISTSGRSIRYGLRNFYNFCLSPLVVTHTDGRELPTIDLDTNTFFQAYFCNELEAQLLDEDGFTNMYAIRKSERSSYFSNIKLRMLHLMYSNENITLGKMTSILESFGYEVHEIIIVLNEFLNRKKALMWSSSLSHYSLEDLELGKSHFLYITHLGIKYFENLIRHPLYLRECVFSVDNNRLNKKDQSISRTLEVVKDLEDVDCEEIKLFIKKESVSEYKRYFNVQDLSISDIIWGKMKDHIKSWLTGMSNISFDYKRQYYIKERVNKILKEYESPDN